MDFLKTFFEKNLIKWINTQICSAPNTHFQYLGQSKFQAKQITFDSKLFENTEWPIFPIKNFIGELLFEFISSEEGPLCQIQAKDIILIYTISDINPNVMEYRKREWIAWIFIKLLQRKKQIWSKSIFSAMDKLTRIKVNITNIQIVLRYNSHVLHYDCKELNIMINENILQIQDNIDTSKDMQSTPVYFSMMNKSSRMNLICDFENIDSIIDTNTNLSDILDKIIKHNSRIIPLISPFDLELTIKKNNTEKDHYDMNITFDKLIFEMNDKSMKILSYLCTTLHDIYLYNSMLQRVKDSNIENSDNDNNKMMAEDQSNQATCKTFIKKILKYYLETKEIKQDIWPQISCIYLDSQLEKNILTDKDEYSQFIHSLHNMSFQDLYILILNAISEYFTFNLNLLNPNETTQKESLITPTFKDNISTLNQDISKEFSSDFKIDDLIQQSKFFNIVKYLHQSSLVICASINSLEIRIPVKTTSMHTKLENNSTENPEFKLKDMNARIYFMQWSKLNSMKLTGHGLSMNLKPESLRIIDLILSKKLGEWIDLLNQASTIKSSCGTFSISYEKMPSYSIQNPQIIAKIQSKENFGQKDQQDWKFELGMYDMILNYHSLNPEDHSFILENLNTYEFDDLRRDNDNSCINIKMTNAIKTITLKNCLVNLHDKSLLTKFIEKIFRMISYIDPQIQNQPLGICLINSGYLMPSINKNQWLMLYAKNWDLAFNNLNQKMELHLQPRLSSSIETIQERGNVVIESQKISQNENEKGNRIEGLKLYIKDIHPKFNLMIDMIDIAYQNIISFSSSSSSNQKLYFKFSISQIIIMIDQVEWLNQVQLIIGIANELLGMHANEGEFHIEEMIIIGIDKHITVPIYTARIAKLNILNTLSQNTLITINDINWILFKQNDMQKMILINVFHRDKPLCEYKFMPRIFTRDLKENIYGFIADYKNLMKFEDKLDIQPFIEIIKAVSNNNQQQNQGLDYQPLNIKIHNLYINALKAWDIIILLFKIIDSNIFSMPTLSPRSSQQIAINIYLINPTIYLIYSQLINSHLFYLSAMQASIKISEKQNQKTFTYFFDQLECCRIALPKKEMIFSVDSLKSYSRTLLNKLDLIMVCKKSFSLSLAQGVDYIIYNDNKLLLEMQLTFQDIYLLYKMKVYYQEIVNNHNELLQSEYYDHTKDNQHQYGLFNKNTIDFNLLLKDIQVNMLILDEESKHILPIFLIKTDYTLSIQNDIMTLDMKFASDFHNIKLQRWEPFIESIMINMKKLVCNENDQNKGLNAAKIPINYTLFIRSGITETLNINITDDLLEQLQITILSLSEKMKKWHEGQTTSLIRDHIEIQNILGYDFEVRPSKSDKVLIKKGAIEKINIIPDTNLFNYFLKYSTVDIMIITNELNENNKTIEINLNQNRRYIYPNIQGINAISQKYNYFTTSIKYDQQNELLKSRKMILKSAIVLENYLIYDLLIKYYNQSKCVDKYVLKPYNKLPWIYMKDNMKIGIQLIGNNNILSNSKNNNASKYDLTNSIDNNTNKDMDNINDNNYHNDEVIINNIDEFIAGSTKMMQYSKGKLNIVLYRSYEEYNNVTMRLRLYPTILIMNLLPICMKIRLKKDAQIIYNGIMEPNDKFTLDTVELNANIYFSMKLYGYTWTIDELLYSPICNIGYNNKVKSMTKVFQTNDFKNNYYLNINYYYPNKNLSHLYIYCDAYLINNTCFDLGFYTLCTSNENSYRKKQLIPYPSQLIELDEELEKPKYILTNKNENLWVYEQNRLEAKTEEISLSHKGKAIKLLKSEKTKNENGFLMEFIVDINLEPIDQKLDLWATKLGLTSAYTITNKTSHILNIKQAGESEEGRIIMPGDIMPMKWIATFKEYCIQVRIKSNEIPTSWTGKLALNQIQSENFIIRKQNEDPFIILGYTVTSKHGAFNAEIIPRIDDKIMLIENSLLNIPIYLHQIGFQSNKAFVLQTGEIIEFAWDSLYSKRELLFAPLIDKYKLLDKKQYNFTLDRIGEKIYTSIKNAEGKEIPITAEVSIVDNKRILKFSIGRNNNDEAVKKYENKIQKISTIDIPNFGISIIGETKIGLREELAYVHCGGVDYTFIGYRQYNQHTLNINSIKMNNTLNIENKQPVFMYSEPSLAHHEKALEMNIIQVLDQKSKAIMIQRGELDIKRLYFRIDSSSWKKYERVFPILFHKFGILQELVLALNESNLIYFGCFLLEAMRIKTVVKQVQEEATQSFKNALTSSILNKTTPADRLEINPSSMMNILMSLNEFWNMISYSISDEFEKILVNTKLKDFGIIQSFKRNTYGVNYSINIKEIKDKKLYPNIMTNSQIKQLLEEIIYYYVKKGKDQKDLHRIIEGYISRKSIHSEEEEMKNFINSLYTFYEEEYAANLIEEFDFSEISSPKPQLSYKLFKPSSTLLSSNSSLSSINPKKDQSRLPRLFYNTKMFIRKYNAMHSRLFKSLQQQFNDKKLKLEIIDILSVNIDINDIKTKGFIIIATNTMYIFDGIDNSKILINIDYNQIFHIIDDYPNLLIGYRGLDGRKETVKIITYLQNQQYIKKSGRFYHDYIFKAISNTKNNQNLV